jgi:hypothetical protein
VDKLVKILYTFSQASGMKINWEKSCWFDQHTHKPE